MPRRGVKKGSGAPDMATVDVKRHLRAGVWWRVLCCARLFLQRSVSLGTAGHDVVGFEGAARRAECCLDCIGLWFDW